MKNTMITMLAVSVLWGVHDTRSATVTWDGAGDMIWTQPDSTSWSGSTYNSNDIVQFLGGGEGTVTLEPGLTPGATIVDGAYTFSGGGIGGTGTLTKSGSTILQLSGPNTFTGDITINGGTLRIGYKDAGLLGGGNYAGNISIAANATLFIGVSGSQELSGVISGAGGVSQIDGSTLILSGENTYSGKTDMSPVNRSGTTLSVSSFNSVNSTNGVDGGTPSFPSSSLGAPTTVANGTIPIGDGGKRMSCRLIYTGPGETTDRVISLGFNESSQQTIEASGTGLLKLTSPLKSNASPPTHTGSLNLDGTGSGEIVAALPTLPDGTAAGYALLKTGTGTWTLGGDNEFPGPTRVSGGSLLGVTGGSCSNSAVTVNSGCAFGVQVTDSTSTWTCASLAYNASSTSELIFDINTSPSKSIAPLSVVGDLVFDGVPTVVVDNAMLNGGTFPLVSVGGIAPTNVPPLDQPVGTDYTLAWGDVDNKTLYLSIPPKGSVLIVR